MSDKPPATVDDYAVGDRVRIKLLDLNGVVKHVSKRPGMRHSPILVEYWMGQAQAFGPDELEKLPPLPAFGPRFTG